MTIFKKGIIGIAIFSFMVAFASFPIESVSEPTKRVNKFNRLMKPKSERNLPPARDGIHDPDNEATHMLQHPKEAFSPFEKSSSGNYVNWVKTLNKKAIEPRYDKDDPEEEAMIFDLDIVREVKGSMPDVVYPHDRHTEWLDCSNCHPDIFVPEKGKNQISMAQILLGQKCGVCHGKVAFPVSECRLCHSKKKPTKKKKKK
ncbi:MAG: cytochrome c, class I [Magnetococcales bacterium]|nr:cytochrome c, class I [Magnetococcales bacterium]